MFTHKLSSLLVALLRLGSFLVFGITAQAASDTIVAGQPVTLSMSVDGTAPFTYQWYKNGAVLSGATAATYQIASFQTGNVGVYSAVISNSAGSTTSDNATLALAVAPAITTQPVGVTVTSGGSVTFTSAASGSPAPTLQWKLNGTNIAGATGSSLNISNVQSANAGTYTMVATNSAGSVTSAGATLTVSAATSAPAITTQPVSQTVSVGSTVTLTVAASGAPTPTFQWKLNGANISGATSATLSIANAQSANAGTYTVVATNSAGSATSAGAILTVNPVVSAPVITTQPSSQTVTTGSAVTFTVAASGAPAPTYQWRKNGTNISGATNATYIIASTTAGDAATYTVVATNSAGSATSTGAVLTVNAATSAPVITSQPLTQTVIKGNAVTFQVVASGSPTLSYQWYKSGSRIRNATGTSYSIASVATSSAGTYTVVVSNAYGSVTSAGAVLTVNSAASAPVFTTQPSSQTVTAGNAMTFTAAASGTPTPTYQWQKNGVAISGATGSSYTIASAASSDAATYAVVATNSAGSVTSTGAVLTVNAATSAPTITTQPVSKTVSAGSAVTLTVAASGNPAPTFQWKLNGTNVSGATSATLSIANAQSANAGTYTVVATNSVGAVTSAGAILTVNPAVTAPVITTQPASQTGTVGTAIAFTVAASGVPAPTYQWYKNGVAISGATSATYSIANLATADAATYTVVASNSAGSVTSSGAVLTVTAATTSIAIGPDFNRDGNSDLLWQNRVTGEWSVWLMNGTKATTGYIAGSATTDWQIRGPGDFNRDGQTDLLWQNSQTGEWRVCLMTGTTVNSTISLAVISTNWELTGTGDFNGDGKSDILMLNTVTGECGLWLMNGTVVSQKLSLGFMPVGWRIGGCGDFNNNGQSDILWQNPATGECRVWVMAGTTVSSTVSLGVVSPVWEMSGCGDFNKDGHSDILWQNGTTGECSVWLMNGTSMTSAVSVGTVLTDWTLRN